MCHIYWKYLKCLITINLLTPLKALWSLSIQSHIVAFYFFNYKLMILLLHMISSTFIIPVLHILQTSKDRSLLTTGFRTIPLLHFSSQINGQNRSVASGLSHGVSNKSSGPFSIFLFISYNYLKKSTKEILNLPDSMTTIYRRVIH